MLRKMLSTLVAFVLFGMVSQVFADAAAELEHAESYHRIWNYEPAEAGYKGVYEKYPGTNYALDAYKKLIHMYIEWGKGQQADTALQQMLTDFADRPDDTAKAVLYVADECVWSAKYEKARELYQYVIDNWPQHKLPIWSQAGLVISNAGLGNMQAADAAFNKLTTEFSQDEDLPVAVHNIAEEFIWLKRYEEARQLYQYVLDNRSQSKYVIKSRAGIAASNVNLGRLEEPYAIVDELLADFPGHSELSPAIFLIAEQYYNKTAGEGNKDPGKVRDNLQKVITLCERVINRFPASDSTPEIYDMAADCYRQLARYGKAIECYREIVSNWPDYEHAWNAQFQIGYCSQQLKDTGVIPRSLADSVTKAAYEQVLKKYPHCPAARATKSWLDYHLKMTKGEQR